MCTFLSIAFHQKRKEGAEKEKDALKSVIIISLGGFKKCSKAKGASEKETEKSTRGDRRRIGVVGGERS